MKLTVFQSDRHYVKTQRRTVGRKGEGAGPFYCEREFDRIANWVAMNMIDLPLPARVLCHGARNGNELDEFEQRLNCRAIGTDLFPQADSVIEWDFRKPKSEWWRGFDVVYSNSLDHSDQPEETLRVWLDQTKPKGNLFVEWSHSHDGEPRGGDCFAAPLHEYISLIERVGVVVDLLYAGDGVVVIVAKR